MTNDKRAELVKFLLKNGHGWGSDFLPVRLSTLSAGHRKRMLDMLGADPYYIGQYDVLSDAWITRLSPLALKELADGS